MLRESYNYYQILDVAPSACQQTIHQAYHEAKRAYSPSNPDLYQFFSQQEASEWIDLIEEAYAVIGHPNTRRDYDRELDLSRHRFVEAQPNLNPTQNQVTQELPEGYGKTSVSQYELDPKMEEMIRDQESCDGLFLKKVRTYKNIDLNQFSQLTCIAIRHLYAIENNNFSVLPAPVFVRGYIIQYCRILELDEEILVPSFMSLLNSDI
jgi:curved DNA-binding protein CbpA